MSSAVGDIVNNPALEGEDHGGGDHSTNGAHIGSLAKMLGYGAAATRGIYDAGAGLLKYAGNTALNLNGLGDTNSVPFGRRLLVAAAESPEDKLRTLRQWYPDAMPKDGDFEFYDPIRKKQVTLNDPGLSYGDITNAVPSLGELGGTVLGAMGGGALGGTAGTAAGSMVPGIGNVIGGVGGAIAGAGTGGGAGGVLGKEAGRSVAQTLGSLLNGGGKSFDTRTPEESSADTWSTAKWDAAMSALGPAAQGLKVYAASKFLKPESGALFDAAKSAGYIPSLNQIGSPRGAAVESKLIRENVGDFSKNAAANENVLNSKVGEFLGDNAGATKNDLANALRSGNQSNVSGIKGSAADLYENFPFSEKAIPEASKSKEIVQKIMDLRGPKGDINPIYDFDGAINKSLDRLSEGKLTEKELDQLQTNLGYYIKKNDPYPQARDLLKSLSGAIRDDLVTGAPGTAPAQQEARALWKQAKDTQEGLTSIFGKQEGVTQGVTPTGGMSEGKNLDKGLKVFSNGPEGSDTLAAEMSKLLPDSDKKTLLAAILKQPATANSNGIDAAAKQFNMERVAKFLTNPEDSKQLSDLLSTAQGVVPYSKLPPDTTPLLNGLGQSLLNRTQKYGVNSALNSAEQGNVPGSYIYNPSMAKNPFTVGVARTLPAINHANQPISSYRISPQVMEEGLPDSQKTTGISPRADLESLLAKNQKFSVNLDDYLKDQPPGARTGPSVTDYAGTPMTNKIFQKADGSTPQGGPSELGYQPLDHYRQPATKEDLDNFINQNRPAPESTATQKDLDDFIAQSKPSTQTSAGGITTPDEALKTLQNSRRKPVMPIVNEEIPAAGAAFLKTLSGPGNEGADYHTLVGGSRIEDLSDHPNIVGVRTAQGPSTAFGRYQFINPTWKDQQAKYGYEDMSPANQDMAAWNLAKDTHKSKTGRELAEELASGDSDRIANAIGTLAPVWASLPGGVQQGSGANSFVQDFQQNLNDTPATKGDLNAFIAQNPPANQRVANEQPMYSVNLDDYLTGS